MLKEFYWLKSRKMEFWNKNEKKVMLSKVSDVNSQMINKAAKAPRSHKIEDFFRNYTFLIKFNRITFFKINF